MQSCVVARRMRDLQTTCSRPDLEIDPQSARSFDPVNQAQNTDPLGRKQDYNNARNTTPAAFFFPERTSQEWELDACDTGMICSIPSTG